MSNLGIFVVASRMVLEDFYDFWSRSRQSFRDASNRTNRGVVFVEFSAVFVLVVLIVIFVVLSGIVFLNFLNSFVVAKNFYSVFKDSELSVILEGTQNQGRRVFVFTTGQSRCNDDSVTRCIDCAALVGSNNTEQNNVLADLHRDLCVVFTSSKGYFSVFRPTNVEVSSSRLGLSLENSVLTVTSRFNFDGIFTMLIPFLGSSELALVSFEIRGVTL